MLLDIAYMPQLGCDLDAASAPKSQAMSIEKCGLSRQVALG